MDLHTLLRAFYFLMCQNISAKAPGTTAIRLLFDCNSTMLRPFDDIRYDSRQCGLNKQAVRVATQYAPAPLLPVARCRADAT